MMANLLPDIRDDPSAEMDLPFMDQHSSIKDEEDNDLRMEEVVVGDETIDIPSDLYTGPAASSFISHTIKINKEFLILKKM